MAGKRGYGEVIYGERVYGGELADEEISLLDQLIENGTQEAVLRVGEYLEDNPDRIEEVIEAIAEVLQNV